MKPKVIKTEAEYNQALKYIELLMDSPASQEHDEEIELFATLIEKYEDEHYPIDLPDPIEAIKFVMDQQGLTQKDLIQYIGSQSKVSEVLNHKRTLSLSMMRALHEGLGIPAEILLQDSRQQTITPQEYSFADYPFNEMVKNGYFSGYAGIRAAKEKAEELLINLFSIFQEGKPQVIYCKQTNGPKSSNNNALLAWQAHILHILADTELPPFTRNTLDETFFEELLGFSAYPNGPCLVQDFLAMHGIHFVIEQHLQKTYLDGASFMTDSGNPVVALTLRYDRIDNFWFTLAHELSHIKLHLHDASQAFFDDTNSTPSDCASDLEKEANNLAKDLLIPQEIIDPKSLGIPNNWTAERIILTAKTIKRSPAILAGRIRWESGDYTHFSELLGNKEIKHLFIK